MPVGKPGARLTAVKFFVSAATSVGVVFVLLTYAYARAVPAIPWTPWSSTTRANYDPDDAVSVCNNVLWDLGLPRNVFVRMMGGQKNDILLVWNMGSDHCHDVGNHSYWLDVELAALAPLIITRGAEGKVAP